MTKEDMLPFVQYLTYGDLSVVRIPKAASQSMYSAIGNYKAFNLRDNPPKNVIAFIRDWMDRLVSAFQFFSDGTRYKGLEFPRQWEPFVDRVLDGPTNPHWIPQYEYVKWTPNVVLHPFEKLGQVWSDLGLPELPHRHKSVPGKDQPNGYRMSELESLFSEDAKMRTAWQL